MVDEHFTQGVKTWVKCSKLKGVVIQYGCLVARDVRDRVLTRPIPKQVQLIGALESES